MIDVWIVLFEGEAMVYHEWKNAYDTLQILGKNARMIEGKLRSSL